MLFSKIDTFFAKKVNLFAVIAPFFWWLALCLLLIYTSPIQVGPTGVLIVLIVLYGLSSSTVFLILLLARRPLGFILRRREALKKDMYYLSSVLGFLPVFLLGLNSLRPIGIVEIILVIVLISVASFYVLQRSN